MATLAEKLDVKRKKDFIKENIFHAKHLHPAEPKQRSVDTRRGDTYDLKKSGLLPIYVHKKIYGKVPRCVKIAARTDVREIDEKRDEGEKLPSCRQIEEEERKALLNDMKKKWDELMQQYRALPFLTDTLPKAQRKAKIERALNQLEKDITSIERYQIIYVYDDDYC